MISEGSCDTEEWNNGCWKFYFAITEISYICINYILNIYCLVSIRDFFKKIKFTDHQVLNGSVYDIFLYIFLKAKVENKPIQF